MVTDLPTLHGPFWPRDVIECHGKPPYVKTRKHRVNQLPFRWIRSGESWLYDDSAFVPVTMPIPVPDYTPDEAARIAAAEAKRVRRANRA